MNEIGLIKTILVQTTTCYLKIIFAFIKYYILVFRSLWLIIRCEHIKMAVKYLWHAYEGDLVLTTVHITIILLYRNQHGTP
jgi:hypothetical protein